MKVVFTAPALEDLREIRVYMRSHYPGSMKPLEQRLSAVLLRVGTWPKSAYEVGERPGVRLVALRKYPYKIYYAITDGRVEILHIHHDRRALGQSK